MTQNEIEKMARTLDHAAMSDNKNMTVQDLINFLQAQPEEVKKEEIWYIDISFPNKVRLFVDEHCGVAVSGV